MRHRHMVVAAIIAMMASTGASAETQYRDRIEYYDISGNINSRHDVREAIRMFGPMVRGKEAIGSARGRIGTSYKFHRGVRGCTITDALVKVNVVMRLPGWDLKASAKPDVRRYFGCFQRTVTVHEKRHGEIWRETGQAIEKAMFNELRDVPCKAFKARATEIYNREYRRGRQRQRDFDTRDYKRNRYQRCETGHGPKVAVKASPLLRSYARKPLPTKRFDIADETPQQPAPQQVAAAPRYSGKAPSSHAPEMLLDTAERLLGSAGIVIGIVVGVLGLFAGIMVWAKKLERQREGFGPGMEFEDEVHEPGAAAPPITTVPARRSSSGPFQPAAQRSQQGFGRRGQRP